MWTNVLAIHRVVRSGRAGEGEKVCFAVKERGNRDIQSRPTIRVNAAMMAMGAMCFMVYRHKRVSCIPDSFRQPTCMYRKVSG